MSQTPYRLLLLAVLILLGGCGYLQSQSDRDKEESKWPEDRLYRAAKDRLDSGTCAGAIEYYEKLQARYPFGIYTQQSQLELAYCYYRTEDPASAMATSVPVTSAAGDAFHSRR